MAALSPYSCEIEQGGPVTITHKDMRYFMTIPEAVHLTLRVATMATNGDIFALEMGKQLKVLDMARYLIRLAGLVPGRDIPITFTGLPPGEKLWEELVGDDERMEASGTPNIHRIRTPNVPDFSAFIRYIDDLERVATRDTPAELLDLLRPRIPTFSPAARPGLHSPEHQTAHI
jgi:FlaA1/EpsC-like NDP-sugar epimerase